MTDRLAGFKASVRDIFQTAREDLDRALDKIVAEHAAKGLLNSGGTVKRMAAAFEAVAVPAVDVCRTGAGQSRTRQAHLRGVLPHEVDRLGEAVIGKLSALGHFEHVQSAIDELVAEHRERVLRDRAPPPAVTLPEPRPPAAHAWSMIEPYTREIIAGLLVIVIAGAFGLSR